MVVDTISGQTFNILLAEDDEDDVEAIERAFRRHKIANPIHRVADGFEALKMLRGEGVAPLQRPLLILLDLKMPRMDGLEFLQELRADPTLNDNIVFVLTTSNLDRDKIAAYENCVAGYIIKAQAGEGFEKLIELLDDYWQIVQFPPEKG